MKMREEGKLGIFLMVHFCREMDRVFKRRKSLLWMLYLALGFKNLPSITRITPTINGAQYIVGLTEVNQRRITPISISKIPINLNIFSLIFEMEHQDMNLSLINKNKR
jgi:hypothetical protein